MNKTAEPCLECRIPEPAAPDQAPGEPVCNPYICPKLGRHRHGGRRRHGSGVPAGHGRGRAGAPAPRLKPDLEASQPAMPGGEHGDDEEEEAEERRFERAVGLPAGSYRRVSNRAGKSVIARQGSRRCDPRCLYAKGNVCVCACGGRNHGAGF